MIGIKLTQYRDKLRISAVLESWRHCVDTVLHGGHFQDYIAEKYPNWILA